MTTRLARTIALTVPLLAAACATPYVGERTSAEHSLVVIQLDLSRSPSYWRKVPLACEDRKGGKPWWHMHTDGKGLFYQEGVPPGRCWITGGFQDGIVTRIYKLPEEAGRNPTTKAIGGAGVHYLGSWKFVPKGGDDFDLVRTQAVGEREALKQLLPWIQGTAWDGLVRRRL
ncbi:MAG: hypothetical protein WCC48_13620 [Anaeromyxobacteraceae bacterium]